MSRSGKNGFSASFSHLHKVRNSKKQCVCVQGFRTLKPSEMNCKIITGLYYPEFSCHGEEKKKKLHFSDAHEMF